MDFRMGILKYRWSNNGKGWRGCNRSSTTDRIDSWPNGVWSIGDVRTTFLPFIVRDEAGKIELRCHHYSLECRSIWKRAETQRRPQNFLPALFFQPQNQPSYFPSTIRPSISTIWLLHSLFFLHFCKGLLAILPTRFVLFLVRVHTNVRQRRILCALCTYLLLWSRRRYRSKIWICLDIIYQVFRNNL